MQKTVSQLDEAGYFVGEVLADESPLEPGVYLLPGGCVENAPPVVEAGKRYKPKGKGWQAEDVPQPVPKPAPPSAAELRRAEIGARLAEIDDESVRPTREIAAALAAGSAAPAFPKTKLAAFETEAAALRAELKTL